MPLTMTRPRAALIMTIAEVNACPRPAFIAALSAARPPLSTSRVRKALAISVSSRSPTGWSSTRSLDFDMARSRIRLTYLEVVDVLRPHAPTQHVGMMWWAWAPAPPALFLPSPLGGEVGNGG